MASTLMTDSQLLQASLSGSRGAFGQIVERYKSLVCAIAYSATGDIGLSEDLAQETFVVAWQRLAEINDPGKLRPWLCGIARNLCMHFLRKKQRDLLAKAECLEGAGEQPAPAATPCEQAINKEEQALLWRSLKQIPEIYRLALILYYRDGQSVQRVAQTLGVSRSAVKQRLLRGRRMLRQQVTTLVEQSLAQTRPGPRFTAAVLSVLPDVAARSIGAGAAAAKVVTATHSATSPLGRLLAGVSVPGAKQVGTVGILLTAVVGLGLVFHQIERVSTNARALPPESEIGITTVTEKPHDFLPEGADPTPTMPDPTNESTESVPAETSEGPLSLVRAQSVRPVQGVPAGYPGTQYDETATDVVEGIVYDPSGMPLEGAKVLTTRYGPNAVQTYETTTDARGRYELRVPPGQWVVKARKGILGGEAGPEVAGQLITEGNGLTITKNIHMEERGVIRGRVYDKQTGNPIPCGTVYTRYHWGDTVLVTTDDEGRYEIEGVKEDEHCLIVFCPGYERLSVITNTVRGKDAELDIYLARAGKVTGVVTNDGGRPIAHAWVVTDLMGTGNLLYHTEVCDELGRFEYDGLPFDKQVRLTAMYPCYVNTCEADTGPTADWTGVVPSTSNAPVEVAITLPSATVSEVRRYDRVKPPGIDGAVCGRVVGPTGAPVRDFRILLQWPHSRRELELHPSMSIDYWTKGASFTSRDGTFVLGLSSMNPGQIVRVVAVAEGYCQDARDVVTVGAVNAMPPADALTLRLGPTRSLSVRVADLGTGRRPIEGARVTVMDAHPWFGDGFHWNATPSQRPVTLSTDSEGWARFSGLVLTEGTVVAQKPGYGRERVEWRAGESVLSMSMRPECVVKGQIFAGQGVPLESGHVVVTRSSSGADPYTTAQDELYETLIKPGDQGRFCLDQLPPGTYKLKAHWWVSEPVHKEVGYTDEFALESGEVLEVIYPEDANVNNPERWIAQTVGDSDDETIRRKLIGTWRGEVRFPDGTLTQLVYTFREDGSATLMTYSNGRPQDRDPRGYFKVHQGTLKILQDCGVGTFTTITFLDPDTLVLGAGASSDPPLRRDKVVDEVVNAANGLTGSAY